MVCRFLGYFEFSGCFWEFFVCFSFLPLIVLDSFFAGSCIPGISTPPISPCCVYSISFPGVWLSGNIPSSVFVIVFVENLKCMFWTFCTICDYFFLCNKSLVLVYSCQFVSHSLAIGPNARPNVWPGRVSFWIPFLTQPQFVSPSGLQPAFTVIC